MKPDQQPLVSIILPTFNGSRYILDSIGSCLKQTYPHIEIIIIDDGSTDNTAEHVRTINDPRIKLIQQKGNMGHIAALNKGFALSKGEFLTWTSDDNTYAPEAIATMLRELMRSYGVDFVYTRYSVIDEEGKVKRTGRTEDPSYLDIDNCVGGCFLYRRRVYETIGEFNPEAFLAEDYEYWLRVRRKFKMKKLDDLLYFYRIHDQSLTGIHKELKVQEQVARIRERFIPKYKKLFWRIKRIFGV